MDALPSSRHQADIGHNRGCPYQNRKLSDEINLEPVNPLYSALHDSRLLMSQLKPVTMFQ
jgi:hypothetical protein